jgi:hypothetical protein
MKILSMAFDFHAFRIAPEDTPLLDASPPSRP